MRTWFITGMSTGFGRLLTERLLAAGDRAAGTLRDLSSADDLKEQFGDRLWLAPLDLTHTHEIRPTVDAAWAAMHRIDVLVSNAGYGLLGAAEEVTDAQIRHQIDTNLLGSIQLIRAALPHFRAQHSGRILQILSLGGQVTIPGSSLYHATKWGIEGFMEAVAQEVAVFGISCTIVEPGAARTGFRNRSAVVGPRIPAYDRSPSRRMNDIHDDKSITSPGDPVKMVDAMITSVEQDPAPLRLALGSDSYSYIKTALTTRLAQLEAQRGLALSTDAADQGNSPNWFQSDNG
ncbi:SDR family oxidoreductase [Mycolicibacterium smegmatis]|uniref:SDR family oxidoreductase n=1 Tax=Mycolicibacterium smegmatis TaxID=1772 RepID=UPI0005D7E80F|nr:SDR family oxidoreductase [Mycolicibacterium smegmatis]MDF1897759.1 SDR family oxidoreductase [Mycolicibacterium smegmatis]MDF1904315.1 SDR family oxidoreductase [Mycolicibacterium smegmatis]MDF1917710.1 SDR family oxidoreductase [Mycolicibacterium smegmatis]MDF1923067.1 SDR family oxidoreductase [Mycolicibacterium smegmatis]UAK58189.1 SDR family oxidoreductase [Mycolicibacterium smegmatis]